jgi:hypothetical protein
LVLALCGVFVLFIAAVLFFGRSGSTDSTAASGTMPVAVSTPSAPAPIGFRDYKWGTPLRAVRAAGLKKLVGPTDEGITMYGVTPPGPLFGLPVKEEAYSFSHGKLYQGAVWLDGTQNLAAAKDALVNTYGPPSFANERLQLWKWSWPGTGITARLYRETTIEISIWNDSVDPISFQVKEP